MILVFAACWYAIGVLSFVFWWTRDYRLTKAHVPLALGIGLLGPTAFLVGGHIHRGWGRK